MTMADFAFSVLWILAFSALQAINWSWVEIKRLKENMTSIVALIQDVLRLERLTNSEVSRKWRTDLEDVLLKNASDLRDEIECEVQLWSRGSAGRKLLRFFSSSNPLVFCFRIGRRVKKLREMIAAVRVNMCLKQLPPRIIRRGLKWNSRRLLMASRPLPMASRPVRMPCTVVKKIRELNDNVTLRAKQIVYIVACIVGVCVDPFFLYIPFLSHTKMCLGINTNLWKVTVPLRTVADFFTALILIMSIPQLSRCMSSIELILSMCVKFLALAPIPQILLSEMFILKTLGGYTFWNLILFCLYGARLVLIVQSCEQLKRRVSVRTLVRFNAPVYLFLFFIVSHVIGASWYYLSIKRQLSCWDYACKIITGCIFPCDGTTPSTLNSTLVNKFCPLNPPNATAFDYGIYLDALESGIVEDKGVLKKFLLCFFWGLRNLSSFASNLHTSTNDGEIFFAIIICAVALILLIYVLAPISIQSYSDLESARSERIVGKMELPTKELIERLVVFHNLDNRTKKSIVEHIQEAFENGYKSFNLESLRNNHFLNDVTKTESVLKDLRLLEEWVFNDQPVNIGKAKNWLSDNNIPHDQNNILFYLTCRLKEYEDVNLTSVLSVLPDESKWMTMKDLCFDTLKKVPGLENINAEWFKSFSRNLKPVIYPKETCIFQQGKPMEVIIFITNGIVSMTTIPSPGAVAVHTDYLQKGHFVGAELIKWKLDKISELGSATIPLSGIPISTADVKSHSQVEAFVLMINDLALSSDFPVALSSADIKLRRIISKRMILNTFIPKLRNADSATEGVDSSS